MQPNQPQQPSGLGPQPPYQPPESTVTPSTGAGSSAFGTSTAPQQDANGNYAVVPPMIATPNNGRSGHNPYEFIVSPQTPKAKGFRLSRNAFLMRIGLILGSVVVLMIIVAVALSALAPKGSTPGLTAIAERQQEIIRIADMASRQVAGQDTKNFVTNVDLSVTSDQQQVFAYLSQHGVKIDPKVLVLDHDSKVDSLLTSAASAGTYDTTATQALSDQLVTYQNLLRTTYKQTSNKQAKQLLQGIFTSTNKLAQQAAPLLGSNN